MFKRMSVLVRLPQHTRETFSKLWERHAAPVSGLPRIRGYQQNHIVKDYSANAPINADGFVELLWDNPEDMAAAFVSDAARPMIEDEPGFLGHGSGYALAASYWRFQPDEHKLIVAVVGPSSELDGVIENLEGLRASFRDDVTILISKPKMSPPQPVNHFIHLWFDTEEAAGKAAVQIANFQAEGVALGVYAVEVIRFI